MGLSICTGTESVEGRVREEGRPAVSMTDANSTILVEVEDGAGITADSTLRVDVVYTYTPLTPIGMLIWGDTAEVSATARQRIMSPPPPGYQY
jgi:hypothetical protein